MWRTWLDNCRVRGSTVTVMRRGGRVAQTIGHRGGLRPMNGEQIGSPNNVAESDLTHHASTCLSEIHPFKLRSLTGCDLQRSQDPEAGHESAGLDRRHHAIRHAATRSRVGRQTKSAVMQSAHCWYGESLMSIDILDCRVLDNGKVLYVTPVLGTECEVVLQDRDGRAYSPTNTGRIEVAGMKEALDQTDIRSTICGCFVIEHTEKLGPGSLTYNEWVTPFVVTQALGLSGYEVETPFDGRQFYVLVPIEASRRRCMN